MFLAKLFELIILEFFLKENFTDHDKCPINQYKLNGSCKKCPLNSTSPEGSESIDECDCSHGFVKNNQNECVPCNKYGGLCEYIDLDIEKYNEYFMNEILCLDIVDKMENSDYNSIFKYEGSSFNIYIRKESSK